MITQPATEYHEEDRISFTVSSPNYGGKVEYRVILYNGTTKKTSELWSKMPSYYYKKWQPSGNYKFTINWPVTGMEPGVYSLTVLVRRVGSNNKYDSFVKTNAFWIKVNNENAANPNVGDVNVQPNKIHLNAWLDAAIKAENNLAYKYSIYASRSIAVKHPEVYLQADEVFNRYAQQPYVKERYLDRTKNFVEREAHVREEYQDNSKGHFFKWLELDITKHKPVSYAEIYKDYPVLPILDMRLFSVTSALQGTDWHTAPINMAEFIYFKEKEKGNSPYIIVTEDGKGYVASNDNIYSYKNEIVDKPDGKIILVFNDKNVWYPMMSRNDTDKDSILKSIVTKNASLIDNVPKLADEEMKIIEILKSSTEFKDNKENVVSQIYASRIYEFYEYFTNEQWQIRRIQDNYNTDRDYISMYRDPVIYKMSNYLSPMTAYYAAMAKNNENKSLNDLTSLVQRDISNKYNSGRYGHDIIVGLTNWRQPEHFFVNADDFILTKSSMCMFSATNAAAIFELANLKNLQVYMVSMAFNNEGGGHIYIAMYRDNEMRVMENFHDHGQDFNGFIPYQNHPLWRGIIKGTDWVCYVNPDDDNVYSNMSQQECYDVLLDIKQKSNSKALMCLKETDPSEGISIDDFIKIYQNKKVIYTEF